MAKFEVTGRILNRGNSKNPIITETISNVETAEEAVKFYKELHVTLEILEVKELFSQEEKEQIQVFIEEAKKVSEQFKVSLSDAMKALNSIVQYDNDEDIMDFFDEENIEWFED